MHGKLIQDITAAAMDANRFDIEINCNIIQAGHVQHRSAHTDQKSGTRTRIALFRQQCAMHGHGLRGIFDTAGAAELLARTQRIRAQAVAAGAALDALRIPLDNLIEQAHIALMRDMRGYPCMIKLHRF